MVTDGTAVLGLGDIGPEAAMPVMEGKAVLFKAFGNVDAFPICLATKDTEEIIGICQPCQLRCMREHIFTPFRKDAFFIANQHMLHPCMRKFPMRKP